MMHVQLDRTATKGKFCTVVAWSVETTTGTASRLIVVEPTSVGPGEKEMRRGDWDSHEEGESFEEHLGGCAPGGEERRGERLFENDGLDLVDGDAAYLLQADLCMPWIPTD